MAVPRQCHRALHSQPPSPPSGSTLCGSARASLGMGGAKGVCRLFPEPDWLVLPQRGDVFRSSLCLGKKRGSCIAAGQVCGLRAFGAISGFHRSGSLRPRYPASVRVGEKGRGIPAPCSRFECQLRGERRGAQAAPGQLQPPTLCAEHSTRCTFHV